MPPHVVFRTSPHTGLARHLSQGRAAFQIDEFDEYTQSGWSVPARTSGRVHGIAGNRNFYVRIAVGRLTGRRVLPA